MNVVSDNKLNESILDGSTAPSGDFKKVNYDRWESITALKSDEDIEESEVDGHRVEVLYNQDNKVVGVFYHDAKIGSVNPKFTGFLSAYAEQDPHWPY